MYDKLSTNNGYIFRIQSFVNVHALCINVDKIYDVCVAHEQSDDITI